MPTLVSINVFSADIAGFVLDFFIDTLKNMVSAFMWPVWVIQWQEPWGIGLLIAAFFLFPRFVKQPLEHWLFEGREPPPVKKRGKDKHKARAEKK